VRKLPQRPQSEQQSLQGLGQHDEATAKFSSWISTPRSGCCRPCKIGPGEQLGCWDGGRAETDQGTEIQQAQAGVDRPRTIAKETSCSQSQRKKPEQLPRHEFQWGRNDGWWRVLVGWLNLFRYLYGGKLLVRRCTGQGRDLEANLNLEASTPLLWKVVRWRDARMYQTRSSLRVCGM